jgi:hypothetical protein
LKAGNGDVKGAWIGEEEEEEAREVCSNKIEIDFSLSRISLFGHSAGNLQLYVSVGNARKGSTRIIGNLI